MNSKVYKWCAVPLCKNTSIRKPNKLFVHVPNKQTLRDNWLTLASRNPRDVVQNSSLYFCEDHFDLPNDMDNYMQYHIMGSVSQVRMKPGCVPKKFACQKDRKVPISYNTDRPSKTRKRKIALEQIHSQKRSQLEVEKEGTSSSTTSVQEDSTSECSETIEDRKLVDCESNLHTKASALARVHQAISMNIGTCLLCFAVNVKTYNIKDTHLQYVYESIADFKVQPTLDTLCYICRVKLQQCYHLLTHTRNVQVDYQPLVQLSANTSNTEQYHYVTIKQEPEESGNCTDIQTKGNRLGDCAHQDTSGQEAKKRKEYSDQLLFPQIKGAKTCGIKPSTLEPNKTQESPSTSSIENSGTLTISDIPKKKNILSFEDAILKAINNELFELDEDKYFCTSLVQPLKRMNVENKMLAKVEILNVISKFSKG